MRYVALFLVCILLTSNASAEKFGEKCYKSPNFSCIISLAITSALATNDDVYKSELLSHIAKLLVYNSQSSEAKDPIRSIPNAYRQRIIGAIVEAKFAIGKKEEGLTVLKEMGPPSTWTLANLSKTYQLGKFRDKLKPIIIKSESLIKELKETYYKIGALSELSTFCFNIGNSEKAEQLLQEAKRFAKTLRDTKEYTRAQAQIAKAYVSGGNIKEGLAFSRSLIKNYQIKRKSDPDNFLLPYDVLVGVAIEVLSDIAIYLHDNGNHVAATKILGEAKTAALKISVEDDSAIGLNNVARAFIKFNDINEAIRISKLVKHKVLQGSLITSIVCHLGKTQNLDRAYKILRSHRGHKNLRARYLANLARMEYRQGAEMSARKHLYGELDLLRKEYDELDLLQKEDKLKLIYFDGAYSVIAEALAYIGDIETALEIAKNINSLYLKPDRVRGYIVQSIAESKNIPKAIEIMKSVSEAYARSWALISIAENLLEKDFPPIRFSHCRLP